jgi:hypothetical protein
MKKYIIILAVFVIGCSPLKDIYSVKVLNIIDFTPFTAKNFLITPENYTGTYQSIGLIEYIVKPSASYKLSTKELNPKFAPGDPEVTRYFDIYKWNIDNISFDAVLNEAYNICVKMGADAIINFKSEIIYDEYASIKYPVTIIGYRITGFAIKRN